MSSFCGRHVMYPVSVYPVSEKGNAPDLRTMGVSLQEAIVVVERKLKAERSN